MDTQSENTPTGALHSDLRDALQTELGEGLRAVAIGRITDREYDVLYMREDIDEKYTEEMRQEVFEEVILESIAEDHQKNLFPTLGGLQYTIRVFEGGINLLAWQDEEAIFVGMDHEENLICPAIEVCRRVL